MTLRDVAERVIWTGVQAFFASLPVMFPLTASGLRAVGLSALIAVIGALISLGKNLSMQKLESSK